MTKTTTDLTRARQRRCFAAIPTAIVLLAVFCVLPAVSEDNPVSVETAYEAELKNRVATSGTVTSPQLARISSSVPGLVLKVHFDVGADVAAGDVLVTLDQKFEELTIDEVEAQIRHAEAELADAQRRLQIAEKLSDREFGTRNEVDARLNEAELDKATLQRLIAQKAISTERLKRHEIRAPFAGVLSKRHVESGHWIQLGDPVFELVDMTGLRIDVPMPQQYFGKIGASTLSTFITEAVPDKQLPAQVVAIVPVTEESVRTFKVRIIPNDKTIQLAPGMSARVTFDLDVGKRGIVVSQDALVRLPDGRVSIWVVEEVGSEYRAKEQKVEIGGAFDGVVHIRSGLAAGQKVIVRGNESLRDGQKVRLSS